MAALRSHVWNRGRPLRDAIGREAIAKTAIIGRRFEILIRMPLSEEDFSVTLYHEILGGRDGCLRGPARGGHSS